MEVVAGGAAGVADPSDQGARLHLISRIDGDLAAMRVEGRGAVFVLDFDREAVSAAEPRLLHDTTRRGLDFGPLGSRHVEAPMHRVAAVNGIGPQPETTGNLSGYRQRR